MKKHLLCIPTNRFCAESIESLYNEMFYNRKADEELHFAVIDSSEGRDSYENQKALADVAQRVKCSNAYYVPVGDFDENLQDMAGDFLDEFSLKDAVVGNEYSYGKAANRSFMLAIMLGADYIHRRDSDVYLQRINDEWLRPIDIEAEYLGQTIPNDILRNEEVQVDSNRVYMVGSGYVGDWAVDYSSLKDDEESLLMLVSLAKPNFSREQLKNYIDSKYVQGSRESYTSDEISYLRRNNIDVGNSSLFSIFRYVPLSPASYTSGTDYLYHGILDALGYPYLFHNRKVIHKYDENRYEVLTNVMYHYTKALSRCNGEIYRKLYSELKKEAGTPIDISLARKVSETLHSVADERWEDVLNEKLNKTIMTFRQTKNDDICSCAEYIENNKDSIVGKVTCDAKTHALLIKHWGELGDILKCHRNAIDRYRVI